MASLNKVILIGRCGSEVEVRSFENGSKRADFALAVNETYTDRSGQRKEQTEWVNIVIYGKLAEGVSPYIRKGSNLYVEGKLHTRSWDDQQGQKHSITEIICGSIQLLDKRQDAQQPTVTATPGPAPTSVTYTPTPQPGYQPQYGPVAQPPRPQVPPQQPPMAQPEPNNYTGDLPFDQRPR